MLVLNQTSTNTYLTSYLSGYLLNPVKRIYPFFPAEVIEE